MSGTQFFSLSHAPDMMNISSLETEIVKDHSKDRFDVLLRDLEDDEKRRKENERLPNETTPYWREPG